MLPDEALVRVSRLGLAESLPTRPLKCFPHHSDIVLIEQIEAVTISIMVKPLISGFRSPGIMTEMSHNKLVVYLNDALIVYRPISVGVFIISGLMVAYSTGASRRFPTIAMLLLCLTAYICTCLVVILAGSSCKKRGKN